MTRIALFSDVHAAPDALSGLLEAVADQAVDALWCLGDVVGYGPSPLQVIHLLRGLSDGKPTNVIVRGNHDQGMANGNDLFQFDVEARTILMQQRACIPAADLDWLCALPLFATPLDGVCLAHGSFAPDSLYDLLWVYGSRSPALAFNQLKTARAYCAARSQRLRLIAVGHFHVPALLEWNEKRQTFIDHPVWDKAQHRFDGGAPLIINPGSITLPREAVAHPAASYVLLEIDDRSIHVEFRRLSWDWRATVRQLRDPYPAGARLRRQMRCAPLPEGMTADEEDLL
jgi:predicted phosphodiesterase